MIYYLYKTTEGKDAVLLKKDDGSSISFFADPANSDYQEFLRWCEAGNEPLPAEGAA